MPNRQRVLSETSTQHSVLSRRQGIAAVAVQAISDLRPFWLGAKQSRIVKFSFRHWPGLILKALNHCQGLSNRMFEVLDSVKNLFGLDSRKYTTLVFGPLHGS